MNKLLFDIEGQDEFVITPEPNTYLVTLRLTPEQAEAFSFNDRITLCLIPDNVNPETSLGLMYIRGVAANSEPNDYMLDGATDNCQFTPKQEAILTDPAFAKRIQTAIEDFVQAVKPDLPEYYARLALERARGTFTA